ncbi:helix-turn-helix domain-containing protein [Pseudoflavonifractor sp. BIOML-A6]|nr:MULTISPECIES: helix-turn-helix domain-containing protein [unclassified Pseudoflavonifractor]MTQ95664.1 helix-turn-helix domain-containing protein [Pseudoflavonifractor sp. BIOML-A16]MTR06046.1 helix-turn-helix domain-containing protein [Pseudoflavonifractor sp. BIOML-A15]MTR32078.1 helix-turn-helix domain-containing protein [Pseudoflavonifractor sp. BIOML-A14]MTR73088.1 helix-turn-helix domain-containing protein [Pseudoflavonifractor sp. BIOML-A18]MTS63689.1 helix-turn-helix domain-containi
MGNSYKALSDYLRFLRDRCGLQVCIKDFSGFIPINKELDEALQPFLAHTSPFCMYMKSDPEHYRVCLSMIRLMYNKCEKHQGAYFGVCHAGLGEYVLPIRSGGTLLGSINAGFFQTTPRLTEARIRRTCRRCSPLNADEALHLYRTSIQNPVVEAKDILPGLELLAEYLGQTYRMLQPTHTQPNAARRYHNSSEDNILTHAIEYIRLNAGGHITVSDLAAFCHCSESYLSRIFKKRTGVNINVYVNKVRMELAKNHLLLSRENIAEIAAGVGFNDPNYFSRVFTQIIGIPPTEFRRRFQRDIPYGDDKEDPAPVPKSV